MAIIKRKKATKAATQEQSTDCVDQGTGSGYGNGTGPGSDGLGHGGGRNTIYDMRIYNIGRKGRGILTDDSGELGKPTDPEPAPPGYRNSLPMGGVYWTEQHKIDALRNSDFDPDDPDGNIIFPIFGPETARMHFFCQHYRRVKLLAIDGHNDHDFYYI